MEGLARKNRGNAMSGEMTPVQQAVQAMDKGGLLVRRWLGCWLDLMAIALIFFLPVFIVFGVFGTQSDYGPVAVGVGFVLGLLYFPVSEGVWGRSLGKLVTSLKVVDKDGRTPAFWRVIVRTLMRLIEVNPFLMGGIPAGIALLATERKQRLGDLMAGTYVIGNKQLKEALSGNNVADNFA
jgi:uncharacterized RDD family membrane protein YckC